MKYFYNKVLPSYSLEIKDFIKPKLEIENTFKIVRMKNLYLLTTIVFSLGFTQITYAQNPVTWEFKTEKINDSIAYLIIEATIKDGWVIYGDFPYMRPKDNGNIPTITVNGGNYESRCNPNLGPACLVMGYEEGTEMLLGNLIASKKAILEYDSVFEGTITKFKENVSFKQKIKYIPNQSLKGYVYFMTYNHEKCMPPTYVDFDVELPE